MVGMTIKALMDRLLEMPPDTAASYIQSLYGVDGLIDRVLSKLEQPETCERGHHIVFHMTAQGFFSPRAADMLSKMEAGAFKDAVQSMPDSHAVLSRAAKLESVASPMFRRGRFDLARLCCKDPVDGERVKRLMVASAPRVVVPDQLPAYLASLADQGVVEFATIAAVATCREGNCLYAPALCQAALQIGRDAFDRQLLADARAVAQEWLQGDAEAPAYLRDVMKLAANRIAARAYKPDGPIFTAP